MAERAAAHVEPVRRRIPRGEREEQMLDAGERIFGARGFLAVSMDEVAEASGITKAMLYQYFGSKEGLYEACVERARARLFEHIAAAAAAVPPRARLHATVSAYFDHIDAHRDAWWVLYGETAADAVGEMRRRNADTLAALIHGASELELDDLRVEMASHLIVGAGEQIGRWWLDRPELPKARAVEAFEAAIGGALAALGNA